MCGSTPKARAAGRERHGGFLQQSAQVGVAAKVVGRLGVAVGQRAALADDAALLVEDERDRVGADAAARDGGLGQGVLDLRLGQSQQRLHELLARMCASTSSRTSGLSAKPVELQVEDGRHLALVGQRQVDAS